MFAPAGRKSQLRSNRPVLLEIADELSSRLADLCFSPPVAWVYNPLTYARPVYARYVERYGKAPKEVLLLGMNPGPFGMAQTGVPFGEVEAVRGWLGLEAPVGRPAAEHPKRPVLGFACPRSEVSGTRLWGWARQTFGTPARFFRRFFIGNYCPLLFLEASGKNRTPDQLPASELRPLAAACDRALEETVEALSPRLVVGVGRFAEQAARRVLEGTGVPVGSILHPSPANPAASLGWAEAATRQLRELGVRL